jgi:hypothetical protein
MHEIPHFIIAGPPRSGTGWMMSCLQEHPEAFIPEREIHYFSGEYNQSPSWYLDHFQNRSKGQRVGEKSPSYFADSDAPKRIYNWNPNTHLIFSLRNPVDRTYAMYCMMLRSGHVSEDIESELSPGKWLVRPSRYFEKLRPYRSQFPDEQLHFLIFDDLKENPRKFARDLFEAAGVDADFGPSVLNRKFGHRKKRGGAIWSMIRAFSIRLSQSSTVAGRTIQWLRRNGYTNWIHRLRPAKDDPSLSSSVRRKLQDYYSDDVEQLRSYLGRELKNWPS